MPDPCGGQPASGAHSNITRARLFTATSYHDTGITSAASSSLKGHTRYCAQSPGAEEPGGPGALSHRAGGHTKALKHASPRHLQVRVEIDTAQVTVTVADYGAGFDPATAKGGLGLLGLRERLRPLGGELRPQHGTAVVARLPVPGAAP